MRIFWFLAHKVMELLIVVGIAVGFLFIAFSPALIGLCFGLESDVAVSLLVLWLVPMFAFEIITNGKYILKDIRDFFGWNWQKAGEIVDGKRKWWEVWK